MADQLEDAYKYPCKECPNDTLFPMEDWNICECSICGHPNDVPTDEQLEQYRILTTPL